MKSRMYQFYELRDEMKKAIANSEVVEQSEKRLVAVVIASGDKELEGFAKSVSANWPRYESDRIQMKERLKKVEAIIAIHEKQDEKAKIADEIASLVLEAIGATKPESKKSDA